ncbi:hypothetical protein NPX13_g8513 [Xylaria arbuscula]|uniref:Uncharacterized protein n=1 Tax=Xylaria arbuscula TaxID=114810 RepID=A0A9W8N812_9PEZI|nr:hypothetical protein NPX13_g8513 [Xylaria arbuscula]
MPITGTCCSDEGEYCPDFGICSSGGTCCYLGDDCEDSGNSFMGTPTAESLPTSSASSSSEGDGDDDEGNDYTSFSFAPTSESPPTPTPTALTIGDGADFPSSAVPTNDIQGASEDSQTSITVTHTATVTATTTPSSVPLSNGQDGGFHGANCLVLVGFALGVVLHV